MISFVVLFQLPASHEDTPFTYIDSLEGLQKLRDDLREVTEFAIDLEVSILESLFYVCINHLFPLATSTAPGFFYPETSPWCRTLKK